MAPPFPTVLVINLDGRPDRWAAIASDCRAAGLDPIRVPAVSMTPGWQGCGLSHLECLRIAKQQQMPWVLVLEDDAAFTPAAIERFRSLLPFLWKYRLEWGRFNGGPTFEQDPPLKALSCEPPVIIANGLCTHFNLIHSGMYDYLLEWRPDQDRMIDVYFRALHQRLGVPCRSIATVPHISVQRMSVSDIQPGLEQQYPSYFRYAEQKLKESIDRELQPGLETMMSNR
jgi:hypothetical protein